MMSKSWNNKRRGARQGHRRVFMVEALEDRKLLATTTGTFSAPSLTGLITQAWQGTDTSRAAINTMLSALQAQLTSGPLADLTAGTVDGNGFVTEVQGLVGSYVQNVDQQLLPHFVNIDQLLRLQGQRVAADMVALNQGSAVGLITSSTLATEAKAAINSLTAGPIYSLATPISDYVTATQVFETQFRSVATGLGSTTTALSTSDANLTVQALAEAYRANLHAGLQVTHPNISNEADTAITTLENASAAITSTGTAAQTELTTAITAFDTALLGTTGLFGSQGTVSRVNAELGYVPQNLTVQRSDTTISSVSGTGTSSGTADLTATLTSASTGKGIAGAIVSFTLAGAFAGTAVTDSSGVATLTGVPTSSSTGTTTGSVVASFAGDLSNKLSFNSGDLVLNQDGSTTSLVSSLNPSATGQSVTFTATVVPATGTGTPTGTVTFKDGTTTLGTGTLNGSGVATFSTSTLSQGTHSITAAYGGDTNFTTSTSTAVSQVVNQRSSTTTVVSSVNPSVASQPVTFTATVAPATGTGTPTGTVTFKDGTTTIGTGTLNGSGVATVSSGTLAGGAHSITAVYGGDTNFTSSTSSPFSQQVNPASTTNTLASNANPSVSGQSVTFTATVAVVSPGTEAPTGTVNFLDGSTQIGTGTLDDNGKATFSTGALTVGTHSITAVSVGNAEFATSTSNVVSQVVNA
jgi:hypothetical protein